MTGSKLYQFDFTAFTAMDIAKIRSNDPWRVCEVMDKCLKGGLNAYSADEFDGIAAQFIDKVQARYKMGKATTLDG